jgi:hypothetical protein
MSARAADLEGAATISTALQLLGPNGDRWIRDSAAALDLQRGEYDYCIVGALIAAATTFEAYETAYQAVKAAVGGNVARYNNQVYGDFPPVQATLTRAANNLREAALGATL